MTDDELKQLAQDVWAGRVFTDRQLPATDPKLAALVFMLLSFMDTQQLEELAAQVGKTGMIYEYMTAALPRGVNGYPMFASARVLTARDGERFWPIYDRLKGLMEQL